MFSLSMKKNMEYCKITPAKEKTNKKQSNNFSNFLIQKEKKSKFPFLVKLCCLADSTF